MPSSPKDRVRITISLSKELANRIDEIIDGVKVRNRSHAIETLVTDSLELAQVRQAVILLGGQQAIKKVPAVEKMLVTLKQYGVEEIVVAVGFLGEKIKKELGNGEQFGLSISYLETELGTGGALLQLKNKLRRTFLAVNIDQPIEIDLRTLLKFHRDHQPTVTMATQSLRDLTGIYVMEPKLFSYIPEGFCMREDSIFHDLTRQGRLLSFPILTEYKKEKR